MKLSSNRFKHAIAEGRHQLGLWSCLSDGFAVEAIASTGFDWLLLDTEHSPTDAASLLALLQACNGYDVTPIVRPAANDTVLIKRILDLGVQSLLIPYIESAQEARDAVLATRYAPVGIRGVAGMTRATGFGQIMGYATQAANEICVLLQVETVRGLENLEEIASTDGVDGVFIGPADLAASLGFPGQPGHPDVVAVIRTAIDRVNATGKPAGILTPDESFAKKCIEQGTLFTAIGQDLGLLVKSALALRQRFLD